MVADIAIVGGGPAGLALAGMLERAGLDYIVYERSARDTPPRGGCLDLHAGSGQLAMREAGCFEEFRKYARAGDATIHCFWDHKGNKAISFGQGRDSPELDRHQIKKTLLTAIPAEKIVWETRVASSERDKKGNVILSFADGTTVTGFKLVVGADGTWSKVRHLVTPAMPQYSKVIIVTGTIPASNPFYPTVEQMAGLGPMVVMGRSMMIWNQRQGDGHYRVDIGFKKSNDPDVNSFVDLSDTEAVKKLILQDDYFGGHAPQIKELLNAVEGPFRAWPLYYMPIEMLNWSSSPDVTLIGDAAHTTTPFVGDGVNCALRDSVILSRQLKEHGISQEAIAQYEQDMFPYAIDVIERSMASEKLFFDWNSPKTFMDAMAAKPFIGTADGETLDMHL